MFTVSEEVVVGRHLERNWLLPLAQAENVQRHELLLANEYVIYTDGSRDIKGAPNVMSYLLPYRHDLQQRAECRDGLYPWWRLQRPRDPNLIRSDSRILVPLYATHNRFLATSEPYVGMTDIYILVPVDKEYAHTFLAAVLNSKLLDSYHRTFCKVKRAGYLEYSGAALSDLPIRRISFTTGEAEREHLVKQGKELYEKYVQTKDQKEVLSFADQRLPQKPDGSPDTEREQSEVVHDLLAFLAEEMTRLHKEKQSEVKGFLTWLEAYIGVGVEDLKNKTRVKEYWKGDVGWESFLGALEQNRRAIQLAKGLDVTRRELQETIRAEFQTSVAKLRPLLERIELTDKLIDQIVYKLYGLTEEEIAVVEGRS